MAAANPLSFLHVVKPEIDLEPGIDLYSDAVYAKGAENLQKLKDDGVLIREERPALYLYRQTHGRPRSDRSRDRREHRRVRGRSHQEARAHAAEEGR